MQDIIDILKLNNSGCITTDTCNAAQKTHRILVGVINDTGGIVFEQDCYHHLRCIHINGMAKSVVGYMGEILREPVEYTSSFMCDSKFGPSDPRLPSRV